MDGGIGHQQHGNDALKRGAGPSSPGATAPEGHAIVGLPVGRCQLTGRASRAEWPVGPPVDPVVWHVISD